MMDVKPSTIIVVDGDSGCERLASERRFSHLRLQELPLDKLPEGVFMILNLEGEELQQVLGAFFRQKRPFALGGLGEMDEGGLARLCETARRKKARAWVLGGYRVLPIVAAVKEVITGGCLGVLQSLSVRCDCRKGGLQDVMVMDAAMWMCGVRPQGDGPVIPSVEMESGGGCIEIAASGSAGGLEASYDLEVGRGWMKSQVNGHQRTRSFGEIDTLAVELNLLASLVPDGAGCLPGVIPLAELGGVSKRLAVENGR